MSLSVSQLNRLGERLKGGETADDDLEALASYQQEFGPLLHDTMATVQAAASSLKQDGAPTARYKQLRSIQAKLVRSSTRLAQLQDIVGFRVVLVDVANQDALLAALPREWKVVDLRTRPRHGYRAVHVIRAEGRYRVEVQVRTRLQHQWAEFSEALDRLSPGLKYGEGPPVILNAMRVVSTAIAAFEAKEGLLGPDDRDTVEKERDDLSRGIDAMMSFMRRTPRTPQ